MTRAGMKDKPIRLSNKAHHGIVLDVSSSGFDRCSVDFGSIFIDENDHDTIFLFYSGTRDAQRSCSAIGLAVSNDAFNFRKISGNPILEGNSQSFNHRETLTPAITRVGNRFYMVFSGRRSSNKSRRIGIAYADDPKGPWHMLGEILKPTRLWEGIHLDNGPTLVKLDETSFLIFYSNLASNSKLDVFAFLRRYPIRRIGIAKVRIRGPSLSQIETYKLSTSPLKHLNGARGDWNESVFCPGYFQVNGMHHMVPAASTYSVGFPYKQYIGIASSEALFFDKTNTYIEKLIDGPYEKSKIIPSIKSQIALDSPSPLFSGEKNKLFLYYSVADRADYIWKMALTTFDLGRE
ncbi:MAG: family 43 glycosylhydrolase [Candidatus Bathyarchaeota archaeon]|nr:family 43 glycosylhydrolase [Candidatus Bathyarchaeota archaeon]